MATDDLRHPAPVAFYNDPKVRSVVYQLLLVADRRSAGLLAAANAIDQSCAARTSRPDFGFWNQTAGFDISQTLIHYTSTTATYGRAFWVGLLNTLAGRWIRHRLCDRARLHHRHRAAVEELARRARCRRLRRDDPQHPAAAAASVLVQRCAQDAAGFARQHPHSGRRLSQQPRSDGAGAGLRGPALSRSRSRSPSRSSRSSVSAYGRAGDRSARASRRRCSLSDSGC